MRRPGSRQRRWVILLLALLTFALAYYAGNRYSTSPPPPISGVLLQPALPMPAFRLQDHNGEAFSADRLRDHWSLLFMDPRPPRQSAALHKLVQVHNRLAANPPLQRDTFFIYAVKQAGGSITDTLERLEGHFILLSGQGSDGERFFEQLGSGRADETGLVVYLIDPEARIRALFTGDLDAATIAADIQTLYAHQR